MTGVERRQYERRADDIDATMRLEWLIRHRVMSDVLRELRDDPQRGGIRRRPTGRLGRLRERVTGSAVLDPVGEMAAPTSAPDDVRARGYWEQVWRRFKRDRVAMASIAYLLLLIIAVYPGAWIAEKLLGHGPNDIFTSALDDGGLPVGPMTRVENFETGKMELLILGADGTTGRDEFLRLLYGGRVSLQVAIISTLFVMIIGVTLGAIAGYYRGWADTIVSRLTEITMAFPALLFTIALASTAGPELNGITLGGLVGEGVVTLVLVFTLFGWFYPARIIRAKVLSLREKEFVEAALMTGASDTRIIRSHLLPHLVAPIIVYSTLIVATLVLNEAALSFLGVGIQPPTASWGNLLADAPNFYTTVPLLMLWPGIALVLTTLAFNLLGDGLRDAFDPRSRL
jgi:ABC-type dipeptide/oligopeptide/nickel transport system permease subunit